MSEVRSRFEQIIGDKQTFRVMLDGAFIEWKGTYDVLLADTGEYLYATKIEAQFSPFCGLLRSTNAGEALCLENDSEVAARFAEDVGLDSYYYTCHAGLIDVAIPIRIEGELLATIFCGQVRSTDPEQNERFYESARRLEQHLGYKHGELMARAQLVPLVPEKTLNDTLKRVQHLVSYVSHLGADLLALQHARQIDEQLFRAGEIVQDANHTLNNLDMTWDEFWSTAAVAMKNMGDLIGAACSMILVPRSRGDQHVVTAVVGLSPEAFRAKRYKLAERAVNILRALREPFIVDGSNHELADGPVRESIEIYDLQVASQLDREIWISMFLDHSQYGIMAFFLDKDQASTRLPITNGPSSNILQQLAGVISLAFDNRRFIERRDRQQTVERAALETATHQFIAPLSAVKGHAELMLARFDRWEKANPQLFQGWEQRQVEQLQHGLVSIDQAAQQAARLAYNFSTRVFDNRDVTREVSALVIADDLTGLLIQVARSYQGIAAERGLLSVEVDRDRLAELNGRVEIITANDLFKQAIGNLVDNAVKYSLRGALVTITGGLENQEAVIKVINEGIRLSPGEEEKVFERDYRTAEAKRTYAPGTGLGLPVARDIIQRHGGILKAKPSEPAETHDGKPCWRTTFTIRLPLVK